MVYIDQIQGNSNIIAQLDVAAGLSELAVSESYTKPVLNDGYAIDLKKQDTRSLKMLFHWEKNIFRMIFSWIKILSRSSW
jgi:hypothetical protein